MPNFLFIPMMLMMLGSLFFRKQVQNSRVFWFVDAVVWTAISGWSMAVIQSGMSPTWLYVLQTVVCGVNALIAGNRFQKAIAASKENKS